MMPLAFHYCAAMAASACAAVPPNSCCTLTRESVGRSVPPRTRGRPPRVLHDYSTLERRCSLKTYVYRSAQLPSLKSRTLTPPLPALADLCTACVNQTWHGSLVIQWCALRALHECPPFLGLTDRWAVDRPMLVCQIRPVPRRQMSAGQKPWSFERGPLWASFCQFSGLIS